MCQDNWEWLIAVFFAMFAVAIVILVDRPSKINTSSLDRLEAEYSKLLTKDDIQAVQIMFLRPFTYFFQGISYITIQTGFMFYLAHVMRLLSFEFVSLSIGNNVGRNLFFERYEII